MLGAYEGAAKVMNMDYELLKQSIEYMGLGIVFGFFMASLLSLLGWSLYEIIKLIKKS